jgi:hypothetical protein
MPIGLLPQLASSTADCRYLPVPYAARVTCVVGDPINVRSCGGGDVDVAHTAVCDALRAIHSNHREASGYADQNLTIL